MESADEHIIQQIRGGNPRMFALLVDRHKDKAMTLAVRMLRNRGEAEEATQDAFLRAYKALDRFEGNARFGTWFYRILYNVCVTRIGKRRTQLEILSLDDENSPTLPVDESPSPLLLTEQGEIANMLHETLQRMPLKYNTIITMFYIQELSHEEIADITGIPVGTVKIRLHRGRLLMKQALSPKLQSHYVLA